jgi:hypothetical protein
VKYASVCLAFFDSRFTTTADVPQMLLAYLMTNAGLQWYRQLTNERIGTRDFSQKSVDDAVAPLLRWFIEFTSFSWNEFAESWNWYLKDGDFHGEGNIRFWTRVRSRLVIPKQWTKPKIYVALGTLGLILAIMPVSESGVERIFSHLRDLLRPRRDQMAPELVDARLVVKLNNYPDTGTCEARLRELDNAERSPEAVIHPIEAPPPDPPVIPRFAPGSLFRTLSRSSQVVRQQEIGQ